MKTTFIARRAYRSPSAFPALLTLATALLTFTPACARRSASDAQPPPAAASTSAASADAGAQDLQRDAGAPRGEKSAEAPCAEDLECAEGLVCEGCGDVGKICLPGCRADSDCRQNERCTQVQCVRCPCPPLCQ